MEVKFVNSTGAMKDLEPMLELSSNFARICYSPDSWEVITQKLPRKSLKGELIDNGHHSVFEHVHLNFYLEDFSKAFVMLLNNEKQYVTSEKSARYTEMSGIAKDQKELYDKWKELLIPEIDRVYPQKVIKGDRETKIKKLAQENARYMTSVFTPTKTAHTVNLRQLNFLQQKFEDFLEDESSSDDEFKHRLTKDLEAFLKQTEFLRVEDLNNQTERELSLLNTKHLKPVNHYGDTYSRSYLLSFAGLGQSQRHRTISHNILRGTELGSPIGFYVPPVVKHASIDEEWISDLDLVSQYDFPQAQLLNVYERGNIEDFLSKVILRVCGHAQREIMYITSQTAEAYEDFWERYGEQILNPKCTRGKPCVSPCDWGGKNAKTRLV